MLARNLRRASKRRMGEVSLAKLLTVQDDSAYVSPDLEGAIARVKLRGLSLLLVRINVVDKTEEPPHRLGSWQSEEYGAMMWFIRFT